MPKKIEAGGRSYTVRESTPNRMRRWGSAGRGKRFLVEREREDGTTQVVVEATAKDGRINVTRQREQLPADVTAELHAQAGIGGARPKAKAAAMSRAQPQAEPVKTEKAPEDREDGAESGAKRATRATGASKGKKG